MHTITLQIYNSDALKTLKTLENKRLIGIVNNSEIDSLALPGEPLSITEFKNCISEAESSPTVSLKFAIDKWESKRKQLQKITK